jgi:SNF2 family DNA or RNA helicase
MYMNKNNNHVYINKAVRLKGKKVPLFDKINLMKEDLKELIPEVEEDKFLSMLSHIRNFYYGKLHYGRSNPENLKRKKELTANERLILDYLLKNKFNPSTTYRWFIACRLPSDVKEKLQKGQVSFKKAVLIADNRKKSKLSNTGLLMIEEINNIVRSL